MDRLEKEGQERKGQVGKKGTVRVRNRQEGTEKRERNTMKGSDREREGYERQKEWALSSD